MAAALRITAPLLLFLLLATTYAAAQNTEDSGIGKQLSIFEKLQDYNRFTAESTLRNVSFLIAFLGGILSFLAPCSVALLPAFLAATAKSRKNLTLEMLVFFAGFSLVFVAIGIALTSLGKISFTTFQQDASLLVQTAGVILVFLGLLMFFGRGFSFIHLRTRLPKDSPGTFLFGALFAVGWSACIGPIIAGIFTMAAILHNYAYTAMLLFFYALGLAIPLFVAAFAYDRFSLSESSFVRRVAGFSVAVKFGKSELLLTGTGMVSGLLLMFLGLFFIVNRGTTAITAADLLGMIALLAIIFAAEALLHRFVVSKLISSSNLRKIAAVAEILLGLAAFAYITKHYAVRTTGLAERLGNAVLENTKQYNPVAAVILAVFVAGLLYFIRRQLRAKGEGK